MWRLKYSCWRENTWKGTVIQTDWACKQLLEDMILVAALVDKLEHEVSSEAVPSGSKSILRGKFRPGLLRTASKQCTIVSYSSAVGFAMYSETANGS